MINLVLDDLSGEARENVLLFFHLARLITHGDHLIALGLAGARERKTIFLRFIFAEMRNDDGIEHFRVYAVVIKGDDAFVFADHICCHADAFMRVGAERIQKIVCDGDIRFCGRCRFFSEEKDILLNRSYHNASFLKMRSSA